MEKIGRYEIVEELGKGAMGLVYKAVDPNIGRTVALKTMRLDVHGLEHDEMLRRFKNEARSAGTLNHPNIVTIYDAGEDQGVFYIAMEFIEGESLQHVLNEHRVVSVERILSITKQVCAGLDYAHQHGVIHRDVKPANIMLTPDGTAKIMDFGIAKAGGGMTSTGQVLGTPNYMAPEQIKGKALDGRSDLFSVGVMLYEMLTGEKPFVGQNVTTIIYKIVNENPIPPRELDVSIHPGLSAVVTKALSKGPDERYQRGCDLVRDLENYKSFGSDAGATQMFATTVIPSTGDQTLAGPAPSAVAPVRQVERVSETQKAAAAASQSVATQSSASIPAAQPPAPPKKSRWPLYGALIAIVIIATSYMSLRMTRQSRLERLNDPEVQKQLEEAGKVMDQGLQIAQQVANLGKPSAVQPAVPPVTPPTEGFAQVNITSEPMGATVQIDGQPQPGVTPLVLSQVLPGKHTITATLEGFPPVTKSVDLAAGKKKDVPLQFKAEMGVLNVTTKPNDAELTVDGKPYGRSPAHMKLPVGEHTVALTKEGFDKFEEKITISASQPVNLLRNLTPNGSAAAQGSGPNVAAPFKKLKNLFGRAGKVEERGTLVITTKPAGAQVVVNGSPALGITPVRTPVPAGKYQLVLKLDGYKPVVRDFVVEKDKITGIDEILLPN